MKNKLDLKNMISLLVGVIALVVVIPTIALIMNKQEPKGTGYEVRVSKSYNGSYQYENDAFNFDETLDIDTLVNYIITDFSFNLNLHENYFSINYKGDIDPNDLVFSMFSTPYTRKYYFSNDDKAGIYDFSHYTLQDINNNDPLEPIYTPW